MNYEKKIKIVFLLFLILNSYFLIPALAAAPEELKKAVQDKSSALQEINNQISIIQKELDATQGQKKTLKKELDNVDYSIKQVSLGIRSSEINIEKLKLEIESLQYDIDDAENKIILEKEAIIQILRLLKEKDNEGFLLVFLKNTALSDAVLETQNLANLNDSLSQEIENLRNLRKNLKDILDTKSEKKQLIELENKNLKNKKIIAEDQKKNKQFLLAQTKNQEKAYQDLIGDLEKRQTEVAAEIEKIEEELRQTIDPSLLPIPRPGVLAMPVNGRLTQSFGDTPFSRAGGYRGKIHNGIDIGAPIGAPVFAAEDGRVMATGDQDKYCYRGAYGKFILIEHKNNLTTLYAHLSRQIVKENDIVKRGDLIGYVGKTGYAIGPHLHFTVYGTPVLMKQSRVCGLMPFGGYLNPLDYL